MYSAFPGSGCRNKNQESVSDVFANSAATGKRTTGLIGKETRYFHAKTPRCEDNIYY